MAVYMRSSLRSPSLALRRGNSCIRVPSRTCLRVHSNGRHSETDATSEERGTLSSLDALLGSDTSGSTADKEIEWWKIPAKQAAAPRQKLMSPSGQLGRFINEDLFASRVRTGRSTQLGEELDLPKAEPFFCYLLIAIQLSVYAAGTCVGVGSGPEAAQEWALTLSLDPALVRNSGELWHLGTSLLLHSGLPHLALDCFMLGYMAPGAEALLGHWVFLGVYLLSGLTGSTATLLWGSQDPTAGATAAVLGVVGAMVGYELRNQVIVKLQQQKEEPSTAAGATEVLKHKTPTKQPWVSRPVAVLGLVGVTLFMGMLPEGIPADNIGHLAGLAAGVGLGYSLGPRFVMTQEVEIPMGSMMVPEDAVETLVVVDQRGDWERVAAAGAYLTLLWALLQSAL